ncbi:phosphoribosyltransferase [Spirochaetia bacterium]|nr:phosphoribosyltransferase [Spirochaetia bacterium]
MNKVILKAEDLDGYLTQADKDHLSQMDEIFKQVTDTFTTLSSGSQIKVRRDHSTELRSSEGSPLDAEHPAQLPAEERLISLYNEMGAMMQGICKEEPGLHVYSFQTPHESHAEASRLIAKLRDVGTPDQEFVYYIQRAYEMLFKLAYGGVEGQDKNYLIVRTPVTVPVQNFAVHKITNIDNLIENTVMCVMLRGALLPSMIMSKEIEEYSSHKYVTPFALFRIKRDERKHENDMEYILDLDKSFFNLESLNGKDLIFADPMNATGGSLVTVVKYLLAEGVKPKSIQFFNVISALKGALRVVRALDNCQVYTLWMDPVLNDAAYIMPGLGDAGDRINGKDGEVHPRNIIQLIANYGSNIARLYRAQLREIEDMVLDNKK